LKKEGGIPELGMRRSEKLRKRQSIWKKQIEET